MRIFEANISNSVIDYFVKSNNLLLNSINTELEAICGIKGFFSSQIEIEELTKTVLTNKYESVNQQIDIETS